MQILKPYLLFVEGAKTISELNLDPSLALYLREKNEGHTVSFMLYTSQALLPQATEESFKAALIGQITIKYHPEPQLHPYHCFMVATSAVQEKYPGYGPVLYDMALQYCQSKGQGLAPDHDSSLSPAARKIWTYYYQHRGAQIEHKPIDNIRHPLTPTLDDDGKVWPENITQLEDTSPINHVYFSKIGPQYLPLLKKHQVLSAKIPKLEAELSAAANELCVDRIA